MHKLKKKKRKIKWQGVCWGEIGAERECTAKGRARQV